MLYMPKIADYLKISADEEIKHFIVKYFAKCLNL